MFETKNTSMSRVRNAVLSFCALSTIGLMSVQPALADCTRHFVNHTDKTWLIDVLDNHDEHDVRTVLPHETVAYTYTTSLLNGTPGHYTWASRIRIMGPAPENYTQTFDLKIQDDGDCVYISHSGMGNTGSATVNEPANGDLKLWRAD
ncbi:MAG: hypothetical protein JKY32_11810 [Rhizobiales bacterium]|nr:hypothetical protein [Hyphomicrobiales bacterium]